MPTYEYRCNSCGREVSLFYKSYKDFDKAVPVCNNCQSTALTRIISSVSIAQPSRDYRQMSSTEMLSVMESGNGQEMGKMMQQIGQGLPDLGSDYHEATSRLVQGESPAVVEQKLASGEIKSSPPGGSTPAA